MDAVRELVRVHLRACLELTVGGSYEVAAGLRPESADIEAQIVVFSVGQALAMVVAVVLVALMVDAGHLVACGVLVLVVVLLTKVELVLEVARVEIDVEAAGIVAQNEIGTAANNYTGLLVRKVADDAG